MKISGVVVRGKGVGGTLLGFPTANIFVCEGADIKEGVYKSRVKVGEENYSSVSFFRKRLLETHIFDFSGDLYGQTIEVELEKFIRPEQKFDSPEALKEQIKKDINGL